MSHMKPEYQYGEFATGETADGGGLSVPWEYRSDQEWSDPPECETGWFFRLSAPGYLDCTDWDGPHETCEKAQTALSDQFGDDT